MAWNYFIMCCVLLVLLSNMLKFFNISLFLIVLNNLFSQTIPSFIDFNKDSVYNFYCNIDFPLNIKINGANPDLIEIKAAQTNIYKLSDSLFQIRFLNPNEDTKIKLYYKNLPVDIIHVKTQNLLVPEIKLGNTTSHKITKTELNAANKIDFVFPDILRKLDLQLFSCTIKIMDASNAQNPYAVNLRSYELPVNVMNIFQKLPINSTIQFSEIRVKTRNNHVMNLEGESPQILVIE